MLSKLLNRFYLNNHPEGNVPATVKRGVVLLYLALIIQMANNSLDRIHPFEFITELLLAIYIIFATGEGRKWARIVTLIFIVFNLLSFIWASVVFFQKNPAVKLSPLVMGLFLGEILLEVTAIIMLFSKSAAIWFNRPRVAL
jgi:hypothetical protein